MAASFWSLLLLSFIIRCNLFLSLVANTADVRPKRAQNCCECNSSEGGCLHGEDSDEELGGNLNVLNFSEILKYLGSL